MPLHRIIEQTKTFMAAAKNDKATNWEDQYLRLPMHFDTGAARYSWLNTSLFVARGRLLGSNHIEYEAFRVT